METMQIREIKRCWDTTLEICNQKAKPEPIVPLTIERLEDLIEKIEHTLGAIYKDLKVNARVVQGNPIYEIYLRWDFYKDYTHTDHKVKSLHNCILTFSKNTGQVLECIHSFISFKKDIYITECIEQIITIMIEKEGLMRYKKEYN